MRIWDYIKATTIADIAAALQKFFDMPNVDVVAHLNIILQMYTMEPIDTEMYIEIHYDKDDFSDEEYWSVSGKYPPGTKQYEEWDGYWALGFTPWNEVKSMNIVQAKEDAYDHIPFLTDAEIVAQILYEISFYGYEEKEIQEKADRINEMAKDIDSCDLIDHEDFLKMLEEDDPS